MHNFLSGGGEMGELIRKHEWSKTTLGPIDLWPRSLRTCVQIMLTSRQPIWIGWGKDLIKLYNDPYKQIVKGKHPWALGKPASVVWKDIWKDIHPMLTKVMFENEGTYVEEQLLIMERNGYPEETYYTFSYTPVAGDDGVTAGMICFNTDDTDRIIIERQLKTLTELGKSLNDLKSISLVYEQTARILRKNPYDFPFAIQYESHQGIHRFVKATSAGTVFERKYSCIDQENEGLSNLFLNAFNSGKPQVFKNLIQSVGEMPRGAWSVPPGQALILSIAQRGNSEAYGYLVVGLNPFRVLDSKYIGFFQLVADQIATSLANIHIIEEERKRLEALAEIDRAKTVFFSNISHEFRTPLTLILGSSEELLRKRDDEVGVENKTRMETIHRNALRLLRLVNNLLDFSRIEAGKEKPILQPVNISQFTQELASNFSSLVETAGLSYEIDIDPIGTPVFLDKVMWEKIVLNLISNAFKYTLNGKITVSLKEHGSNVLLSIKDTGVGIPEEELPKMFERFHRVQKITGRTYEGTGIGLSLVSELVKLHAGNISVKSKAGEGSEFVVEIPLGQPTKDVAAVSVPENGHRHALADTFIEEASSLLQKESADFTEKSRASLQNASKVLVVDDSPDMRNYIKNILQNYYVVDTATNGKEAIEKINDNRPDLVLSDIMMPVMDGVQMMKAIKSNPGLQSLPVILLSARAGEEARIEGYEIGADDYLVKPFSSKELIARISSQIKLISIRKEVESNLRNVIMQSPVATTLLRGPSFVVQLVNAMGLEIWGRSYHEVINKPLARALPEVAEQGFIQLLEKVYSTGEAFKGNEVPVELLRFGKPQTLYLNFIYTPLRNDQNDIIGIIAVGIDVSEQVYARHTVEEARSALNNAIELAELGTWEIDLNTAFTTFTPRVADWWGLPQSGAPLHEVIECMHEDDRPRVKIAVEEAIKNTGEYAAEYRLINARTKDERYIQARGNVLYNSQKKPIKLTGIVRDITLFRLAHQELERQVRERTKELEILNQDMKRSNDELSQFAYIASHDLQEPLRKIQTFSDLARNHDSPANLQVYLDKIDNSAARMSTLIKDVLLFSKIARDGQGSMPVDLNEVLDNVKNDFELLISERGAQIENNKLPVLMGSKLHYHQLFANLIGNALKFNEKHPRIQIQHSIVDAPKDFFIKVGTSGKCHELIFNDNGIGFDPIYAEQIFNLFTRLHNRSEYKGTGIGLALCKKIIENYHGSITATSGPGKGATFKILLPVYDQSFSHEKRVLNHG